MVAQTRNFSTLMMICLVIYKKNKNRIAAAYMHWYFDDQMEDFLIQIRSWNKLSCPKVKLALGRDFNHYVKTKTPRRENCEKL